MNIVTLIGVVAEHGHPSASRASAPARARFLISVPGPETAPVVIEVEAGPAHAATLASCALERCEVAIDGHIAPDPASGGTKVVVEHALALRRVRRPIHAGVIASPARRPDDTSPITQREPERIRWTPSTQQTRESSPSARTYANSGRGPG